MTPEEQTIAMWTRGNYQIVGDWFAAASRAVLHDLDLAPETTLLDVACGTGAVAIEAAKRGAKVTGVDLTPAMLDVARERAVSAGVEITWTQGSFEQLEHLGIFDHVTSSFGVMLAQDPAQVARQLTSACAVGGKIGVAAWHPDGAFGSAIPALEELLAELPPSPKTTAWAERAGIASIFGGLPVHLVHHNLHKMALPFDSVQDALAEILEHSGPWMMLMEYLDSIERGDLGRSALRDHLSAHTSARSGGGIDLRVSYALSTLERRPD